MIKNFKGEIWKRYRDTYYWTSTYGRVKRVYSRSERLLKPYRKDPKKGGWYLLVKVYGKPVKVSTMVWEAFNGPIPAGYALIHRNRYQGDNALVNLQLLNFEKLGSYYGGRTKKRNWFMILIIMSFTKVQEKLLKHCILAVKQFVILAMEKLKKLL